MGVSWWKINYNVDIIAKDTLITLKNMSLQLLRTIQFFDRKHLKHADKYILPANKTNRHKNHGTRKGLSLLEPLS